jgi:hypothetical protein
MIDNELHDAKDDAEKDIQQSRHLAFNCPEPSGGDQQWL